VLSSSEHVQLIGVAFPGLTAQSARLSGVSVKVDNSSALSGGTSNVYAVHSFGTGFPDIRTVNINNSTIITRSAGSGNKRSVLVSGNAHFFNCRNTVLLTTNSGGGGSYIAAEVNRTGAQLRLHGCSLEGASADLSQTAGTLTIGTTNLSNSNANGLGFSTDGQPPIFLWAQPGVIGLGTNYYRPGTASLTGTEVFIRLSQKCIVKTLNVRSLVGPGIGTTVNWTIRKNGVDTILTVSMNGSQTSALNEDVSVSFDAGDNLSLKVSTALLSTIADTVVQVEII
jgi:hypothetical protein